MRKQPVLCLLLGCLLITGIAFTSDAHALFILTPTPSPTYTPSYTPSLWPTPSSIPYPLGTNAPRALVSQAISVYQGPGVGFAVIGGLVPGDAPAIVAVTPDGAWYRIRYNRGYGWIFYTLVTVQGDLSLVPIDISVQTLVPLPSSTSPSGPTALPATYLTGTYPPTLTPTPTSISPSPTPIPITPTPYPPGYVPPPYRVSSFYLRPGAWDLPYAAAPNELDAAAEIVKQRLTAYGPGLSFVSLTDNGRILVETVGDIDPTYVGDLIQPQGWLEFVDFFGIENPQDYVGRHILTTSQQAIAEQFYPTATPTYVLPTYPVTPTPPPIEYMPDPLANPLTRAPFVTIMSGDLVDTAYPIFDDVTQQWGIHLQLTLGTSNYLDGYTAAMIGQPVAIVLDGEVVSASIIEAPINGEVVIMGSFDSQQAMILSALMQYAPLPFPVYVEAVMERMETP